MTDSNFSFRKGTKPKIFSVRWHTVAGRGRGYTIFSPHLSKALRDVGARRAWQEFAAYLVWVRDIQVPVEQSKS